MLTIDFPLGLALGIFLGDDTPQWGGSGNITYTVIYICDLTFVRAGV